MERIFGSGARPAAGAAFSQHRAIVPIAAGAAGSPRGRWRAGWRWATAGIAIGGALALSLGVGFGLDRNDRPASAPIPLAEPRPMAGPEPIQVRPALAPAEPAPQIATRGDDAIAGGPAAANVSTPTAAAVADPSRREATGAVKTAPAARPSRWQDAGPCARVGRAHLAWCMRPQLVDADRRLRHAYDQAVRAGVSRGTLVAYRQRWVRLRSRTNADPRGVASGYRQIARQLDAARGERF